MTRYADQPARSDTALEELMVLPLDFAGDEDSLVEFEDWDWVTVESLDDACG